MSQLERDQYWDIVKGLGIIAIVLGHSGLSIIMILIILNYYHLAIFFFVSGFLYNDKHSKEPIIYAGRKLRDIWWPTIKYVIVFIILHNVFLKVHIYSTLSDQPMIYPKLPYSKFDIFSKIFDAILTTNYSIEMAGAMWFVLPLVVGIVIFSIIRYSSETLNLKGKKKEIYSLIFSIILGTLGSILMMKSLKLAWRADVSLLVMPVIYCGYLCKIYWSKVRLTWYLAIVSVVILYFLYKYGLQISFAAGSIGNNPILFVFATLSGVYINLYLAKHLVKVRYVASFLAYLGRNSFHIMALHFLSFKVINFIDVMINNKPSFMIAQFPFSNASWWPLNLLAGLLIPITCVYVYQLVKNNFVNKKMVWNNPL